MQRSQRDTQRRNDYSTLNTNISNYMTNNNGKFPAACDGSAATLSGICAQQDRYLNSTGEDPTGNKYKLSVKQLSAGSNTVASLSEATTDAGSIVIVYQQADCSGTDDATGYSKPAFKTGSRNFAIYGQLENGTYCMASQ